MKPIKSSLALLLTLLACLCMTSATHAARPNPPVIAGSVPILIYVTDPGTTNAVPVPPRVHLIDERGRILADVETTVDGASGTFHIDLKKAGTYVVWAYYPAPNQFQTAPQLVDVVRKQTSTVTLTWPPN